MTKQYKNANNQNPNNQNNNIMMPEWDNTEYQEHLSSVEQTIKKGIESLLKKNGVHLVRGKGYIKDRGLITVELNDGGIEEVIFNKLILATGTKPLDMPAFPFDHQRILSSDDLLRIDSIPESITIVGGGVIGCEFAFILASLGSHVTIVEALSRLLPIPSVDESCSKVLQREMKKRKIKIITAKVVVRVEQDKEKLSLIIGNSPFLDSDNMKAKDIPLQIVECEKMAVCVGRTPIASEIGIENIGLKTDDRGWINVNERL